MKEYIQSNKLKIIVNAVLAVFVCILLVVWFSTARYKSQVSGRVEFEPSLFNTVLLGDLKFLTDSNGNYLEENGRLSASIAVDTSMEFGALDGEGGSLTSSERRLRPGSVIAIPFTVTNGTSLGELADYENNLAGTDILYKLNLITTVNIPLEYDVYEYTTPEQLEYMKQKSSDNDYNYENYIEEITSEDFAQNENWGEKLAVVKGDITLSETIGFSRNYEVRPSTYVENEAESTEKTNKFFLQRADDGDEITVKRYMLFVYWPDVAENDDAEKTGTKKLRSTKFMKEIDILEIRLEIESWIDNNRVTNPVYQETGTPLLRISSMPLGDERYYSVAESGGKVANLYSRTTIPFYATTELDDDTSYLDFTVTNKASALTYVYDEKSETYHSSQITSLSGGKVAIAVPVKSTMGNVNDYTDESVFSYELVYKGKTYIAEATSQMITTEVNNETVNAYQIFEFYDVNGNAFTLPDFVEAKPVEEQLRLCVTSTESVSYDNKDDFKILIYQ